MSSSWAWADGRGILAKELSAARPEGRGRWSAGGPRSTEADFRPCRRYATNCATSSATT